MNNFDQSSTGTNISFHIGMDDCIAQMYYDEFVEGQAGYDVEAYGKRNNDYIVVGRDLNKPYYVASKLKKMKKEELYDLFLMYELGYYTIESYKKPELINELMSITIRNHYSVHYNATCWHELESDYTSHGYSQGDAVKINLLQGVSYEKEHMDNLLWNRPIYAKININDDEIYAHEFIDNPYDIDKDLFCDKLSNYVKEKPYHDELIEFINNNYPNSL